MRGWSDINHVRFSAVKETDVSAPLTSVQPDVLRLGRSVLKVLGLGMTLVLTVAIILFFLLAVREPPALGDLTIEAAPLPVTACFYQAELRGYFRDEGVTVTLNSYPTGKQAVQSMLDHGSTVATCADTPFVRAFAQGSPLTVLAKFGDTGQTIRILGRRDRGLTPRLDSLIGRRLGCARGTNSEYVLSTALLLEKMKPEQLTIIDLPPEELPRQLTAGTLDAIVLWDPFATRVQQQMGAACVEIRISDFYRAMWLLVGNSSRRNEPQERAVLRALIRASDDLTTDPQHWLVPLAERMGITSEELQREFAVTRFRVTIDQSLLLNLEAQWRWSGIGGRPIFSGISPLPLAAIDRDAVTLIHPDLVR